MIIRSTLKHLILLFVFSSFYSLSFSETSPLQVQTRARPDRVTLGDEIQLTLEVRHPLTTFVSPPSPKANVSPFEIKKIQTSRIMEKDGIAKDTFLVVATVFELGDKKIPPIALSFKDDAGQAGEVLTQPVTIHVVSVPRLPTDRDDIRPIKPPISLDLGALRTIFFALLAVLLSAVLAVIIVLRRRKQRLIDLESLKPPHERVFLELERLKNKGFLDSGKVKEFYSEFADILRRYLERRFGVETLELTSFEILQRLKNKEIEKEAFEKIKNVFENSDLVKFAKYIPPRSLAEQVELELARIVELTL